MDAPNNDNLIRANSMPPVQDSVSAEEELSRKLEKLQEIRINLCRSADEVLASKLPRERSQSASTYQHRPFDREAIREHFMGGAASVIQKCRELTRQWGIPARGGSASPEAQRSPAPVVALVNGVSREEGLAGASREEAGAAMAASPQEVAADEPSHKTNGIEPISAEDAPSADSRASEPSAQTNNTAEQQSISGEHQPATNPTPTEDGDHLLDDPMDAGQGDEISDVANADHLLDEPEPVEEVGGDSETTAATDRVDAGGDIGVNTHVENQPNSEDARVVSVEQAGDATRPLENDSTPPEPEAECSPQAGVVVSSGGDNGEESTSTPRELPEPGHSTKRDRSKTHHRVQSEAPLVEEPNGDGGNAELPPIADGLIVDEDGDEDELEEEDGADMDELEEEEEDDGELMDTPNARAARKPLPSQPSTSADSHNVVDPPANTQLSQYEVDLLARHKFKPFNIRLPLVFNAKALVEKYEAMEKCGRKRHVSSDPIDQLLRETNGLLNRKRRTNDAYSSDSDFDEHDDDESTVASTSTRTRKQDAKRVKLNASNGSGRKEKPGSSGARGQGGGGAGTSSRGEKATTSKKGKQPRKDDVDDGESGNEEDGESDEEIQLSPRKKSKKLDRLLALSTSIRSDESDEGGGEKVQRKKKNPDASSNDKSRRRKTVYTVSSDSDSDDDEFVDEEEMASDATDDGIDTIVVAGNKKTRRTRSHGQSADKADQRSRKKALQELEDRRRKRKRGELVGGASKKPGKRRRVAVESDDDEEEEEEEAHVGKRTNEGEEDDEATGSGGRMRFRKMIPKSKLSQSTKDAERAEAERVKRLKQRQLEFNAIELVENARTGECEYTHPATTRHARVKSVVLDDDREGRPPCPVAVHPLLVRKLMPHQAEGIRFLYNSTFESLSRLNESGGGAILAHWMGLGKTLQVIAYLHTIFSHPRIAECASRVLVIGPKNVAINWCKEFKMWLGNKPELNTINVVNATVLTYLEDRLSAIKGWYEHKGPSVLVLNYELFRVLTEDPDDRPAKRGRKAAQQQAEPSKPASKREKKLEKMKPQLRRYLQDPGPDLVICDEGHRLKSEDTALHRCVSKIATPRRICLTGTPLQNKLMEYYTMVNFVKPNLLGNIQEFRNRFSNIIEKGRSKDADRVHVRAMRHRCHVLYRKLEGVVDRKSHGVIASEIPPKNEYVVFIRLTPRQIALYRAYLTEVVNRDSESRRTIQTLYAHFHTFSRICAHPYLLIEHNRVLEERAARREADQSMRAFVVDDDDDADDEEGARAMEQEEAGEGSDDIEVLDEDAETPSSGGGVGRGSKASALPKELPQEQRGWFQQLDLVSDTDAEEFSLSNKLLFLAQIIRQCEKVGDKLLVFSQSLESIRLIKRMLQAMADHWFDDGHADLKPEDEQWGWQQGEDYLVIDGQTSGKDREDYQNRFNDMSDPSMRMRLLIISTRAGSLGTNLVGANRVVIFDVSWNPTHDTQALFRSYRLGQRKPVYVYRLVAQGTMEERIYARCVTKEATALRVVDEAQIQRIFYARDLDELYRFDPDKPRIEDEGEEDGDGDGGGQEGPSTTTATTNSQLPKLRLPEDMMLAAVIRSHEKCIVRYDRHDSLFAEQEEEQLDDKERAEAWQDYDDEINNRRNVLFAAEDLSANPLHLAQDMRDDPVYPFCWNVKGMTEPMAQLIVVCSRMFDRLLTVIPPEERGEDVDFKNFILDICTRHGQVGNAETLIDEIYRGKDSTLNTIASFNPTVQQMFKSLHMTMRPIINQLLMQHQQLKQHQKEREG